jgi:hypothetical protein
MAPVFWPSRLGMGAVKHRLRHHEFRKQAFFTYQRVSWQHILCLSPQDHKGTRPCPLAAQRSVPWKPVPRPAGWGSGPGESGPPVEVTPPGDACSERARSFSQECPAWLDERVKGAVSGRKSGSWRASRAVRETFGSGLVTANNACCDINEPAANVPKTEPVGKAISWPG